MAAFWLKMIGTRERPCREPYDRPHVDFVRRPRRIRGGDRMVLYAVGRGMRVFALARVVGDVQDSGDGRWPYRVAVEYDLNLLPTEGVHIDQVSTPDRDLRLSVRQASYVELTQAEYDRAEGALRAKAQGVARGSAPKPRPQGNPAAAN
jgi:hypothetical protein